MNFIKKLNINFRILLITGIISVVMFSFTAAILYITERNNILESNDIYMKSEVQGLNLIIENQRLQDLQKAQTSINVFDYFFRKVNTLRIDEENKKFVETTNITTYEIADIKIPLWYLNDKVLYSNNIIVDKISSITNSYASIFQKTPEGYVAISSNLIDNQGNNSIDYLIPNSSEIIYTIENGEVYTGFENYFNVDYLIAAKPIYYDGQICGMTCIYFKDELISSTKVFFENKKYFKNGYPFVIDEVGFYKIHPLLENENTKNTNFFEKISKSKTNSSVINDYYIWPEDKNGEQKSFYAFYNTENKLFIGITYFQKDFNQRFLILKVGLILTVIISTVFVLLIMFFVLSSMLKSINIITKSLNNISTGRIIDELKVKTEDEISDTFLGINNILKYLKELDKLAENIKRDKFEINFKPFSSDDILGKTLIDINEKIKKSKETELKINEEEKIKQWINTGIAKFIEISRFDNSDLNQLSYSFISNLVKYLDAVQGGFFVLEGNFLVMTACFAYNKQKIVENKIPSGSGLLGRAVKEKKSIILSEIPDNYLTITSGLGETQPSSLFIVPLIFGNEILGVIEIASIEEFKKHQISFVEEISESIASTISNLKVNKRTEQLLKKSQEQSQLMEEQKGEMQKNIKQLQELKKDTDKREIETQNIFKAIDSTALVAQFDIYGKILSINDKFLKTINQDKEQIIGKYHKNITSIDTDSEQYRRFWNDLSEGKSRTLIESININNKITWLSQAYTPILGKDNKVQKILNIAIDITENKLLEKELRSQVREMNKQEKELEKEKKNFELQQKEIEEKDNKLTFLLNSIDFSFIRIEYSIQGLIISVNSKFLDYYGFRVDEVIGKNIQYILIFEDDYRYEKQLEKVKRGLVVEETVKCLNKKGELIKFKITVSPVKNEKNIVTKVQLVGTEINQ